MKDEKIIITVGRQIGSGGRTIARILSDEFHCTFYDKEILNLAARESGLCEKFFEENDERKGTFGSLSHFQIPFISGGNTYDSTSPQEQVYQFQSDVIRKAAEKGSCVFVGRTADYLLKDHKDIVNIFITAIPEARVKRVCQRMNIDAGDARKYIKEQERGRALYYNFYTGKKWGFSTSYDLCIDSSVLGIKATADYIAEFIRQRFKCSEEKGAIQKEKEQE
jgi:cytidylate kinase